ncbi:Copper-transporting P-type ATPase [Halomonadaceae bacterium LMG 33818]|uniref:heavy metal translocating P-type ATPase n=1 Tax=Cernens ardua TaxID=3402176 RepID=UPI003EDB90A7
MSDQESVERPERASRQPSKRSSSSSHPPVQSVTLALEGMSCASCVRRVEKGLLKLDPIQEAQANFANGTVRIVTTGKVDTKSIKSTLDRLGYPLVEHSVDLNVEDMTCASCVRRVEKALMKVPGVMECQVNLVNGKAHVISAQAQDNTAAMISALERMGYPAQLADKKGSESPDARQKSAQQKRFRQLMIAISLTVPLVIIGMGMDFMPSLTHKASMTSGMGGLAWIEMVLTTLVLWLPGRSLLLTGFKALLHRAPEMNTLVGLGAGTAWLYSLVVLCFPFVFPEESRHLYFEPAGVVVTLILLGRFLEARAKGKSNDAIRALMGMQVKQATILRDGQPVSMDVDHIHVGDTLIVRTGERVAVDGEVVDGHGSVDESMLTGEPAAVPKSAGDPVFAATINQSGSLTYRATRVGQDTTLAHIVQVVEEAQSSKLPIQSLVDKVSSVFVPVIMALALLTFVVWWLCGAPIALSISVAVSVLVIACPCAMGLATPVSLMVASGRAAQLGILLNQSAALQTLRNIKAIAFDKTGTLTQGQPSVTGITRLNESVSDMSEADIVRLAASLESRSEHPLARAINAYAEKRSLSLLPVENVDVYTGQGIVGEVAGSRVAIGNEQLLKKVVASSGLQINGGTESTAGILSSENHSTSASVFYMAIDGTPVAIWKVEDPLKSESAAVVHWFHQEGIHVALLSGDERATADSVADCAGITQVLAPLMPEEKLTAIKTLQQTYGAVAFVGDGINDAPALAQSDVGIAMGQGTDIAIESGDIVLMSDSLWAIADAVRLSRATLRNIEQNLGWAFGYNVLLIPLAAGVLYPSFHILLSPMLAALAMAFSSVLVVTNALRLRKFRQMDRYSM